MILGLKAQWSEAELHIMASRLQGAKRAAAERGELRLPLPAGYLYDDQGNWIIDLTRRSRPQLPICSRRLGRPARPMASSACSRTAAFPSAPGAARGRVSSAGGG